MKTTLKPRGLKVGARELSSCLPGLSSSADLSLSGRAPSRKGRWTSCRSRSEADLRKSTWPRISDADRFLSNPILPVAQKAQPKRHPTWVETQKVSLSRIPMRTHSMELLSERERRYLETRSRCEETLLTRAGKRMVNLLLRALLRGLERLCMQ